MVFKKLKFICWYCKSEFASTVYNIDKIKDFKVICPFCDAVCVGELPSYEKIKDLSEEELNPIATIEPIKKERSN